MLQRSIAAGLLLPPLQEAYSRSSLHRKDLGMDKIIPLSYIRPYLASKVLIGDKLMCLDIRGS